MTDPRAGSTRASPPGGRRSAGSSRWWATWRSRSWDSTDARIRELTADVDHVFHLAAIYDVTAPAEVQHAALGNFGEVAYALAPKIVDQVLHMGYRMFPDSAAAKGEEPGKTGEQASSERLAFAHLLKGVHW